MALSTQPYKGMRDFYPEDMRLRQWMFGKWRQVCEQFGYEEYDTPILEPIELYTAKTSEEIISEQSYSFDDRGGRKVIMRPEMTPSVSRLVAARRQELPYPLRLYSIPNCFRYERPQRGRLREFWQLNVDVFGDDSINAETEMIQLMDALMKSFGATDKMYEIRINSRQMLNRQIEEAGVRTGPSEVLRLIDAIDKTESAEFKTKLAAQVQKPDQLYEFLISQGDFGELSKFAKSFEELGVNVKVVPALARGFDYYNNIVFEVFDKHPDNNRSMFGGGRYDGLVGAFGVEPVPTVGFGMGDVTMQNFLESHKLLPDLSPATELTLVLIGDVYQQAQPLLKQLREEGVNVSVDATDRKLDKKLKAADKSGVRHVLFVGESELAEQQFPMKDLRTGEESKRSIERIISMIKDFRKDA